MDVFKTHDIYPDISSLSPTKLKLNIHANVMTTMPMMKHQPTHSVTSSGGGCDEAQPAPPSPPPSNIPDFDWGLFDNPTSAILDPLPEEWEVAAIAQVVQDHCDALSTWSAGTSHVTHKVLNKVRGFVEVCKETYPRTSLRMWFRVEFFQQELVFF
ncbi:hypothetical protein SERLADRAFT_443695 [Serpula lacrymans var. lacrymans S7.9]|uniref:Uncharacterized protein n=1 Tax=Serpula lacrymans var. lacrymans (strain S7.9) TaxID=578457 RepID=F8PDA7_SERL9|nr:uncharacterized protein SERLADRAFT_443695 [Serpula lacrymans var. lacrymans S7.9]EGO18728.1 hypothetical protein SERLADRAFT_443695 [Serpula lacrymans var. lacrymans S7.9]